MIFSINQKRFMKNCGVAGLLLGISSPFVMASDAGTISARLSIDKIMALQTPEDIQISPEGKWIAYVVSRNDEEKDKGFTQVWMSSVDGKASVVMARKPKNQQSPKPRSGYWIDVAVKHSNIPISSRVSKDLPGRRMARVCC